MTKAKKDENTDTETVEIDKQQLIDTIYVFERYDQSNAAPVDYAIKQCKGLAFIKVSVETQPSAFISHLKANPSDVPADEWPVLYHTKTGRLTHKQFCKVADMNYRTDIIELLKAKPTYISIGNGAPFLAFIDDAKVEQVHPTTITLMDLSDHSLHTAEAKSIVPCQKPVWA